MKINCSDLWHVDPGSSDNPKNYPEDTSTTFSWQTPSSCKACSPYYVKCRCAK